MDLLLPPCLDLPGAGGRSSPCSQRCSHPGTVCADPGGPECPMQILTPLGSISLRFPGPWGSVPGRRRERAALQPCGQGTVRPVGNPLLLHAGRDDRCCVRTCGDLNIFICLYFQNGNRSWVITGLVGLLGCFLASAHTSLSQRRGQRTKISRSTHLSVASLDSNTSNATTAEE